MTDKEILTRILDLRKDAKIFSQKIIDAYKDIDYTEKAVRALTVNKDISRDQIVSASNALMRIAGEKDTLMKFLSDAAKKELEEKDK